MFERNERKSKAKKKTNPDFQMSYGCQSFHITHCTVQIRQQYFNAKMN